MPTRDEFDHVLGEVIDEAGDELRQAQMDADQNLDWDTARDAAVAKAFTPEKRAQLERLIAPWRERMLVREHAMLALIPLLPALSACAAQWLVYASFTVVGTDRNGEPTGAIANFDSSHTNVLGIDVSLLDKGCWNRYRFPPKNAAARVTLETSPSQRLFACSITERITAVRCPPLCLLVLGLVLCAHPGCTLHCPHSQKRVMNKSCTATNKPVPCKGAPAPFREVWFEASWRWCSSVHVVFLTGDEHILPR